MCWAEGGRGKRHLAERRHGQPGWPGQQDEQGVNSVQEIGTTVKVVDFTDIQGVALGPAKQSSFAG